MKKRFRPSLYKLESIEKLLGEIKNEIKALKLFLGRAHPDFKTKCPEIVQKVYKTTG